MTTETKTELEKISKTIDLLMTCLARIQDEQENEMDALLTDDEVAKLQEGIAFTTQAYMSLDSAMNMVDKIILL